jgi:predicted ferric reductase
MTSVLGASGPSATWYLTRSTGAVALVLLTAALVLGVLDVRRVSSPRWPRFVLDSLHRNVSLLAVCFLVVHVLTAVLDRFTSIRLLDAVLPFAGSYRPFWLGLGAVSVDLMLAVLATSLMRRRIGYRAWRVTHWLAYASWPIALLHSLGTGTDTKSTWMLSLELICLAFVLAALAARALGAWSTHPRWGRAAFGGGGVFALFLVLWLPGGPLASGWARRSGTPPSLLAHSARTPRSSGHDR